MSWGRAPTAITCANSWIGTRQIMDLNFTPEQQALRQEINMGASPKPFFNERVEELHGGGRDQRRQNQPRLDAREREMASLERLRRALA